MNAFGRVLATVVCLLGYGGGVAAADDGPRVGPLGKPERLVIEGALSFAAADIRRELFDDLDVAAVACPDMPLEPFLNAIARRAAEGYRGCGYADAQTRTSVEDGAVVLAIEEGPRSVAGEIVVTGARAIDVGRLVEELSSPSEPDGRPVNPRLRTRAPPGKGLRWEAGEPVLSGLVMEKHWHNRVAALVEHQGWLTPRFRLAIVPDRATGVARLTIDFQSDGTLAQIGEIEITGNSRDTREEIMSYLDLPPAAVLSDDLVERVENRLLESGRFRKVQVERVGPSEQQPAVTLRIGVKESKHAPRLSQALSREQETLIKFSQWCRDFRYGHEELLLQYIEPEGAVEAVVSPDDGVVIIARGRIVDTDAAIGRDDFQYAFVANHERIAFYSARRGRKLAAAVPNSPLAVNFNLTMLAPSGEQSRLVFGLGFKGSHRKRTDHHCILDLPQTAAAALAAAERRKTAITFNGDEMRYDSPERQLSIDSRTGRLISEQADLSEGKHHATSTVQVTRGEFAPRLRWIESHAGHFVNDVEIGHPVTCATRCLLREAAALKSPRVECGVQKAMPALEKLLDQGLLSPADRLALYMSRGKRDEYWIPPEKWRKFHFDLATFELDILRFCGLSAANFAFERGSWPWMIAHAASLQLSDRSLTAATELARLYNSPATGPLCHWVMAELMHSAGSETWAQIYAGRALDLAGGPKFRQECAALVNAGSEVGRYLLAIGDAMRALDETETDGLLVLCNELEWLDREAQNDIRKALAVLRAHRNEPIATALTATVEHCWHARLARDLEDRLRALSAPPEAAGRPLRQALRKLLGR